jgi:hypothetical protein
MAIGPVIVVGAPAARWEVRLVSSQQRFSTLSQADPVYATVKASQGGAPIDPTAGTARMAFMPTFLAQPASGDWKTASWDTNEIGEFVAQCDIGSAGAITLAAGTWWVWVHIAVSPADIVRQTGSIVVE